MKHYLQITITKLILVFMMLVGQLTYGQAGINASQIDAQTIKGLESIAPIEMPNQETPALPEDSPLPEATGSKEIIAKKLDAIVLVSAASNVKADGVKSIAPYADNVDNVIFHELVVPDPEGLREKVKPFLSGEVSQVRINELVREIILNYRANNRPIVNVYVPEQAMINNIIQIVVSESKIGEIRVEGNEHFNSEMLAGKMTVAQGEPLMSDVLQEDILWLNKNPFRQVELIYEKGKEPGTTDIVLNVNDRVPVRGSFGFSDSGNNLTAFERYTAGLNWGNAFFRDDQMNYGYTTSGHSSLLKAHSLSYTTILPWRHTLTLIGSYADSGAEGLPGPTDLEGLSWSAAVRYGIPWRTEKTFQDSWTFGVDFKRSDNALLQNQVQQSLTITDVTQFVGGYNITFPQETGAVLLGATVTYSPGGIGGHNHKDAFTAAGAGDPDYVYTKLNAAYIRQLPGDCTLSARSELQFASDTLSGGEKFGVGGATSVRGYDNREANGDDGYLVSAEVRSPSMSMSEYIKSSWIQDDSLQFLAFFDCAGSRLKSAAAGTDANVDLMSVGPGMRYNISTYVSMSLDYGFQLMDSQVAALTRNQRNRRAHFSLNMSY